MSTRFHYLLPSSLAEHSAYNLAFLALRIQAPRPLLFIAAPALSSSPLAGPHTASFGLTLGLQTFIYHTSYHTILVAYNPFLGATQLLLLSGMPPSWAKAQSLPIQAVILDPSDTLDHPLVT